MQISLNGEIRDVPDGVTVAGFVAYIGLEPRGLAVERNRAIVPKSTWDSVVLVPGDALEIVQFVGGGL